MSLERQLGDLASALDHSDEAGSRERRVCFAIACCLRRSDTWRCYRLGKSLSLM
jgi:hypothetical protein